MRNLLVRLGLAGCDNRAERAEMDAAFRRDLWRWLAGLPPAIALGAVIARGLWPALTWGEAFWKSAGVCMCLFVIIVSPWYGYRRIMRKPRMLYVMLIVLGTLVASVGLAYLVTDPSEVARRAKLGSLFRELAGAVVGGAIVATLSIGIARMRLRDATQRLAADAERERLARQSVQAELKLLQAQVEPHFLFNTLANVRHLVQSGSRDALPMLDHLIHYLRTALPDIRADSTTLGREGELARAYLEIMRMRMGGGLRFSIDIAPELRAHAFPPLMLMTLVENAVKHGIAPVGHGEVRIVAVRHPGKVVVAVADDGRGLGGPVGQGVGLANVRERLRALYGEAATLSLESGTEGRTVALLEVPAAEAVAA